MHQSVYCSSLLRYLQLYTTIHLLSPENLAQHSHGYFQISSWDFLVGFCICWWWFWFGLVFVLISEQFAGGLDFLAQEVLLICF